MSEIITEKVIIELVSDIARSQVDASQNDRLAALENSQDVQDSRLESLESQTTKQKQIITFHSNATIGFSETSLAFFPGTSSLSNPFIAPFDFKIENIILSSSSASLQECIYRIYINGLLVKDYTRPNGIQYESFVENIDLSSNDTVRVTAARGSSATSNIIQPVMILTLTNSI